MNNVNSKNCFRKILSVDNNEMNCESYSKFRKSISARLSAPIRDNSALERVPGHDIMFFE